MPSPFRGERVIGFNLTSNGVMNSLKQHLADGDLGVFVVPVSSTFRDYPNGGGVNNGVLYANSDIYSAHALTLVGYDDTRTYHDGSGTKTGAFLAVNSWGAGWGVLETNAGTAGFCWLGYDYMRTNRMGETAVFAMIDRTNYVPRELARIGLSQPSRKDLTLDIWPGNGGPTLSAFPRGGGALPYAGTITLDITDFLTNHPDVFHLSAMDWGGAWFSPEAGTISSFEIIRADGAIMTNRQTPVSLLNSDPERPPEEWHIERLSLGTLENDAQLFWEEALQTPVLAWADANRDEFPDFVVFGVYDGANFVSSLYLNNRSGGFTPAQTNLPRLSNARLAWGDYNNDGYPDLAVSGRTPPPDLVGAAYLLRNDAGRSLVNSGMSLPQAQMGLAWGDFDQDGDLDLATSTGKLLRNDGGTNFVDTGLVLLGGSSSDASVQWVDAGNDGLLDVVVNGKINMNTGGAFGGPFHQDPLNPPSVATDIQFWHDFNADGLLDAAAQGRIYYDMGMNCTYGADPTTLIWRVWYAPSDVVYSNWDWPVLDAADFNQDGLLDLALSGASGSSADVRFSVFRQETNRYQIPNVPETWAVETFTDIGLRETGFMSGGAGWADWDGDGDLDVLAGGYDSSYEPVMSSLFNRLADRGKPNTPPQPPARFEVPATNQNTLLRFHPAYDAETPASALAYEVRVGTRPGGEDVVSPFGLGPQPGNARLIGDMTLPPGPIYFPRYKNTNGIPGIRLRNLPQGRYYWSVRTVDGGRAHSEWSEEQAFTLGPSGLRNGDVNGDGFVDVADLVRVRAMIAGTVPSNISVADLNNDGAVNEPDATILANRLLEIGVTGFLPVSEATIGPAGGMLTDGQFALTIPPGSFPQNTALKLYVAGDDPIMGSGSPRQLWRIEGLPAGLTGTLTFSGPDWRASPTTAVQMALGQWIRPFGVNDDTLEPVRRFATVAGIATNGRLVTYLPADMLFEATATSVTRRAATPKYTFTIDSGWLWDSYSLNTPHFVIHWDGVAPAYVVDMANELEAAFDLFVSQGFPFENKRNWSKYPVQVYLKDIKDAGGLEQFSDNGASMELNINSMANGVFRRTTLYHELFHLVQGLVNPAYSATEAFDKKLLIVCEATSTWMERFGSADSATYSPENYKTFMIDALSGLSYSSKINPTRSGYALSSMIEYLSRHVSATIVKTIFDHIAAGDGAVQAVLKAASPTMNLDWHHDYYRQLVEGTIYADPLVNITSQGCTWPRDSGLQQETYTARSNLFRGTEFSFFLPGLGAKGLRYAFTPEAYNQMSNTSVFVVSVGNQNGDIDLSVISAIVRSDPRGTVPFELYGADPKRLRARILNVKSYLQLPSQGRKTMRSFIALVTRSDSSEPDTLRLSRVKMAVVEHLDGAYPTPPFTCGSLHYNNEHVNFPLYACNANLNLTDLTGLHGTYIGQGTPGVTSAASSVIVYQDGQIPAALSFHAAQTGNTQLEQPTPGTTNCFTRFTYKSTDGYKISKRLYLGPTLEEQPYVFEPRAFSGGETLYLDADEEHVYYNISVHYTVEMQEYRDNQPSGSLFTFASMCTPLTVHLKRD